MEYQPIWVLLTTYLRTDAALQTIQGIKQNFNYGNIGWVVVDDGSPDDHLHKIISEIGSSYSIHTYNGNRRGVGHNMNWGLNKIWELGGNLVLTLEEDWYCAAPFDPVPSVRLLENNEDISMVRYGYLSAGVSGELISSEDKLWWKFYKTGYQYTFTGHANLKHRRYFDQVGYYSEYLSPSNTELDMCAKYNAHPNPPAIVWPAEYGHTGPFHHIGNVSMANHQPS